MLKFLDKNSQRAGPGSNFNLFKKPDYLVENKNSKAQDKFIFIGHLTCLSAAKLLTLLVAVSQLSTSSGGNLILAHFGKINGPLIVHKLLKYYKLTH